MLDDIVKLAQKRGIKGNLGSWKEFLNSHDKRFGEGLSDPSKRPHETLAAFLKTFSEKEDLKVKKCSLPNMHTHKNASFIRFSLVLSFSITSCDIIQINTCWSE